jgi:ribonuclease HII
MFAEQPVGRIRCDNAIERELQARGFRFVAGVDEVGRGALFGPVFAAAVILSPARPIRGLNDSKQLEPDSRVVLARRIRERAVAWSVAAVDSATIDRINIYQASRLAMKLAVQKLQTVADFVIVDALHLDVPIAQRALIQGDARCHAIAAASILAKVERDACMCEWDVVFPQYGLARHKGYSTPEHSVALASHGLTPLHRLSFEPVRSRSLFPANLEEQMDLFDNMAMKACL